MKTHRFLAVAASIATLSAAASAQQAQPVERITFEQAIDLALKQNLQVRQAENNLELADISFDQSRMSYKPNLQFGMSGNNNFGRAFDLTTGSISNEMKQSASSNVQSSYQLFDPTRSANVAAQRASSVATESDLARARQTAVYNVALNFVAYVSARSRLDVQKENLESLKLQEAQIQRFADAGARPISDLYQVKSNVANAQLQLVQAEQQIENAKFTLMQTLQLDPARDYDFVAPAIPDSLTTTAYNLDSLVTVAYQRRSDMIAAQGRLLAAEKSVSSAGAGHRPSLGLSASYGSSGRFGDPAPPAGAGTFSEQFERNRSGSLSLGLSLPVFDRGLVSLNKRRAQIQRENAQLSLTSTRQTVALDVRRAWYNIRSAQQQLIAAQAALVSATQALEATTQRYNVGAATLLDVTQSRALRVNALTSLNDARYNLVLNQAAMAYFTGELDPKTLRVGR
jgi:outer membrane protein